MRTGGLLRWRCSAGSIGPRTITTSRWSTRTASWWPSANRRRRGRVSALLQLLVEAGDQPDAPIPVAIETSHGLLVACLRATGRPVFPINPMSVSRYRDRHSVARRKSDAGDTFVLANILRTDLVAHPPLPADSELAHSIAVLAQAQQDAVWARTDAHNKLRSLLREFYPAILQAFATKRGGLLRARRAHCWLPPPPRHRRPG